MAESGTVPSIQDFLANKQKQSGGVGTVASNRPARSIAATPPTQRASNSAPSIQDFLANKQKQRGPQPSTAQRPPAQAEVPWVHRDAVRDYLFGKKQQPAPASGSPSIQAVDTGAVGRLWEDIKLLPTGTGKNVGEITEGIFNNGRTDYQQSQIQAERERYYQRKSSGLGLPGRLAVSALQGVEENVESQVSPFNLALLFGGVVGGARAAVEVPSKLSQTLGKLAHLGFTLQMATGTVDAANASIDSFQKGDYETGVKLAVSGLISGVMARSGVQETLAQQEVTTALDRESHKIAGKNFSNLDSQQKAHAVYEATRSLPIGSEVDAHAAHEFIERSRQEGLRGPEVSQGLDERLERAAQQGARPIAPTPFPITPDVFSAGREHLQNLTLSARAANENAAAQDLRAKARGEMAAIPAPDKTRLPEPPTILNVPVRTPFEAETIRLENRKAEVLGQIETDRRSAQERLDRADQMEREARSRQAEIEREEQDQKIREGGAFRVSERRSELAQKVKDDLAEADELRKRARREMASIPSPDKTRLPESPIILDVPVYSPHEREMIQYENQKVAATQVIESERRAAQDRRDRELQLQRDAQSRITENELESSARAAREGSTVRVNDRRSVMARQVMDQLGEGTIRNESERIYDSHLAVLTQMEEGMGYRDTELAANIIRSKRERGEPLSNEENTVLRMQAKRDELIDQMAQRNPRAEKVLREHQQMMDSEDVGQLLDYVVREGDLVQAARNLNRQSLLSGDPMAADLFSRQAADAIHMAELVKTRKDSVDAEQKARHIRKKIVQRGTDIPYTLGNATEIHLPDGRTLKARYAAARLDSLILSHDPFTFRWNEQYEPREMQPRDLDTNENAQSAILVDSKPENYRMDRYLTDNPTALEGPAVILKDGRVAGGNSRLARLSRRLREGNRRQLVDQMTSQFGKFGIDMPDLHDVYDPYVVVRVLDDVPETTRDLIQLGQELNRDTIMGFTPEEQGAMNAGLLEQDDVDRISAMLESLPGEPSLRDVLRHRGEQIMEMMINRGIIPATKRAEYISGGDLTERAKDAFEAMILGKAIDDPNLISTTPASILAKVERSLPSLMRLKSAGGQWDIGDYLHDALRQWRQIDSVRSSLSHLGAPTDSIVDKFYNPENFSAGTSLMRFGDEAIRPKPHPVTYSLVKALEERPLDVKKAFQDYTAPAEGLQGGFFAPPEPYQVFNDTIGRLGGTEVHPADWATVTPATEEQKAAVDEILEPKPKPTREEQKEARVMTDPPNVDIARNNLAMSVLSKTVTPETVRNLLESDPVTSPHADWTMEVMAHIIPNANAMSLEDFLATKFAPPEWIDPQDVTGQIAKDAAVRGVTQFLDDGRALVRLVRGQANASTFVHEVVHVMRRNLVHPEEIAALERFAGVEGGIWGTHQEEIVTRGFERYMYEGKPPVEELRNVFGKIRHVLRDIYGYIRDGKYRLPKQSPINIKLSADVRSTFDRWFGVDRAREMERVPEETDIPPEPVPPASSLSLDVTPQEREEAVLRANGANSIAERLGESRIKRFSDLDEARAWAINNREKLWGIEIYELPNGGAFANFVPTEANVLFQQEPRTLPEMIRRVEYIKKLLETEKRPEIRYRMQADIRSLDARIGVPDFSFTDAPQASSVPTIAPPPDMRPNLQPGQVELLFGGQDAGTSDRPGRVSDATARIQGTEGSRTVDERSQRLAAGGEVSGVGGAISGRSGGGAGAERAGEGAARGLGGSRAERDARREDYRKRNVSSLNAVRAAALDTPRRMRGPATVSADRWVGRMKNLGMPEAIPAPTVKVDDDLSSLLIFPGQTEVVESTLSALDQFDATIIATPTGTGKTYTVLGVVKQMQRRGQADRVLILTKNDSIINAPRKGMKAVGRSTFNLELRDLPKRGKLGQAGNGAYVATYAELRNRPDLLQQSWDLVMMDESAEASNWQRSKQGIAVERLNDVAQKVVYVSATPYSSAVEIGYMNKLGLWDRGNGGFAKWARQFGVVEGKDGILSGGNDPKRLLKLREQLIERGQFVTQSKSMEGFTAHLAQVPLTDAQHTKMRDIITVTKEAARWYEMRGDQAMAKAVRGNAATFMKSYLERLRLPQTIEIIKQMRSQGHKVLVFSETRSPVDKLYDFLEPFDRASGGRVSSTLPRLPGVYEELAKEFGENEVANFSGAYSAAREREKEAFDQGNKPILFATYGAGGIGVSLHDTVGNAPRAAVYLGPPWSGKMFDQAMGRAWRYGTKSNVFSVFMSSDAAPEMNMLLNKVVPRLESLRAAVQGVSSDPLVQRMRSLGSNKEALAAYEMGASDKSRIDDLLDLDQRVLISNYKDLQVPSADAAKYKGMKYPGQVDDRPGVITLFQAGGDIVLPDRFETPDERKASRLNEEIAQNLADGGVVPGVGSGLSGQEPGVRKQLADQIGPSVAEQIRNPGEADPSAVGRQAWQSQLTQVLAAQEAGDITTNVDSDKPAWTMMVGDSVPGGADPAPKPERTKDPSSVMAQWGLSGRQNLIRIADRLGVPEVGQKMNRMLMDYQVRSSNYAGDFQSRYLNILRDNKITKKENRLLFMVKEGKLPPPNERIAKASEALSKLTMDVAEEFAKRDITGRYFEGDKSQDYSFVDMQPDPRYAPHKFNYDEKIQIKLQDGETQEFTLNDLLQEKETTLDRVLGRKTLPQIKRDQIIAAMEQNTGMTRAAIEDWLGSRKRRTPLAGSVERARQANMPFYRMDSNAWMEYFQQAGEVLARAEIFGQDRGKLDALTAQLPSEKGRRVANTIFDGVLAKQPWDQDLGKWYSRWGTATVLSKMSFSAAKVPFHLAHTTVVLESVNDVFRGILGASFNYREFKERALLSGVLVDQMKAGMMMEQAAGQKASNALLKYTGFHALYSLDRIVANAAAQSWMERYALPKLINKSRFSNHIRYQLREKMLFDDIAIDAAIERGRWNQEDLNRGGSALTNRTLFTTDPTELPPAWRSRSADPVSDNLGAVFRIATILKGFTFKTAMLIKQDILDEARRGNWFPVIYAALVYPVVGEAIQMTSSATRSIPSLLTGNTDNNALTKWENNLEDIFNDPTAGKIFHRFVDDVAHATALTILTDVFDPLAFKSKTKREAHFKLKQVPYDALFWLAGPYADSIKAAMAAYEVLGALTEEEGEAKFTKSAKIIAGWAKEEYPVLRTVFPDTKKKEPHYAP